MIRSHQRKIVAIRDASGIQLDGNFSGRFPSGDGQPGAASGVEGADVGEQRVRADLASLEE